MGPGPERAGKGRQGREEMRDIDRKAPKHSKTSHFQVQKVNKTLKKAG
jgi:hypothetical protein